MADIHGEGAGGGMFISRLNTENGANTSLLSLYVLFTEAVGNEQ